MTTSTSTTITTIASKTRSGRRFPSSKAKAKAAPVRMMDPSQFEQRRRSPRSHLKSQAHDRAIGNLLKVEARRLERQQGKQQEEVRQQQEEEVEEPEQQQQQEEDVMQEPDTCPSSSSNINIRRSNRNIHSIRLKGTGSFYRNLKTLFFSKQKDKGYQNIGGNRIHWIKKYHNPPIYVIDDFLTPSELAYFDSCKDYKFQKSFVDNMALEEENNNNDNTMQENGANKRQRPSRTTMLDDTHRTSRFFAFKRQHDSKIASLERRVAALLGCWEHQMEPLQLVRYKPGEFFNVHHDMGDLQDNDEVKLPKKNMLVKRRVLTLFFYLNTLTEDQGGCTYFPKCKDLRVRPKRGRVVIWSNVTADGLPDPRTIHAGEPVISDQKDFAKYGLNLWICEE